jgi:hypothetical protein
MPVTLNLGPEVAQFLFDRSRGPETMSGDGCNVPWNEEGRTSGWISDLEQQRSFNGD